MIYMTADQKSENKYLQRCLDFLNGGNLPGNKETVELGDGIRCIGNYYETLPVAQCKFEAHHKFCDVQCVVSGEEKMGIAPAGKGIDGPYNEQRDLYLSEVEADEYVELKAGSVIVLYPEDLHQVKVQLEEGKPVQITKMGFKVPVELLK